MMRFVILAVVVQLLAADYGRVVHCDTQSGSGCCCDGGLKDNRPIRGSPGQGLEYSSYIRTHDDGNQVREEATSTTATRMLYVGRWDTEITRQAFGRRLLQGVKDVLQSPNPRVTERPNVKPPAQSAHRDLE